MTPEDLREIEDLYHAVRERGPAERGALLDGVDSELLGKVEALLA